jgi:multidrug resistance efflux pump
MPIADNTEYQIAKSEAEKFERALASAREREPSADVDPRVHAAMIESLESELAILREQLERYESLA